DRRREGRTRQERQDLAGQELSRRRDHEGQEGVAPRRTAAALRRQQRPAAVVVGSAVHGLCTALCISSGTAAVGVMSREVMRKIRRVPPSALEDVWQRDATPAAIAAARGVVQTGGPIPPGTPIGRLSDTEWGWILAAMLFAWISKRAEQAA